MVDTEISILMQDAAPLSRRETLTGRLNKKINKERDSCQQQPPIPRPPALTTFGVLLAGLGPNGTGPSVVKEYTLPSREEK